MKARHFIGPRGLQSCSDGLEASSKRFGDHGPVHWPTVGAPEKLFPKL